MADESPQIRLPGKMHRKRGRWWWKVRLPGEKTSRSRALRPQGRRLATTDRQLAQEIAFNLWQKAVRAEAEAAVKAEQATRTLRLKRHFRQKVKTLADEVTWAEARAKVETTARAKLQATLDGLTSARPPEPKPPARPMTPCECCGRDVSQDQLQRIDSGQRLCPQCLDELRRAARQPPAEESGTLKAEPRRASASILNLSFEDPPPRRSTHGPHVLHAQAGRR
jgi:hypothetical protein